MAINAAIVFGDGGANNGRVYSGANGTPGTSALTAMGMTARIKGSFINQDRGTTVATVAEIGEGELDFDLLATGGNVTLRLGLDIGGSVQFVSSGTLPVASIDPAKWYCLRMWWDAGNATKQNLELWDEAANTVVLSGTGANAATKPNYGPNVDAIGVNYKFPNSGTLLEVDWIAFWQDGASVPAGLPTQPAPGATGLVDCWGFNENAGTTATSDKNSWVLTASGTISWDLLSGTILRALRQFAGGFLN